MQRYHQRSQAWCWVIEFGSHRLRNQRCKESLLPQRVDRYLSTRLTNEWMMSDSRRPPISKLAHCTARLLISHWPKEACCVAKPAVLSIGSRLVITTLENSKNSARVANLALFFTFLSKFSHPVKSIYQCLIRQTVRRVQNFRPASPKARILAFDLQTISSMAVYQENPESI